MGTQVTSTQTNTKSCLLYTLSATESIGYHIFVYFYFLLLEFGFSFDSDLGPYSIRNQESVRLHKNGFVEEIFF